MITRERERTDTAGPPAPPAPPTGPEVPWWRSWPSPAGRPRPLNRRSLSVGALIVGAALTVIDGLLVVVPSPVSRWCASVRNGCAPGRSLSTVHAACSRSLGNSAQANAVRNEGGSTRA